MGFVKLLDKHTKLPSVKLFFAPVTVCQTGGYLNEPVMIACTSVATVVCGTPQDDSNRGEFDYDLDKSTIWGIIVLL